MLIVGATGRTGRRLVARLCSDDRFQVTAVVRDPEKARLVFRDSLGVVSVVEGDLADVPSWSHNLRGVGQVVTAVSCGVFTDWRVLLGFREEPANAPRKIDADGIAQLATAAKEQGVRRVIAVTTASAGTPWSPAAIFLNAIHSFSVKHKFAGEQAIRASGLDYIVVRPYGLGRDVPAPPGPRGIEFTQGRSSGLRRHIPRENLAQLCHEALHLDATTAARATFECWATEEHARPMAWAALRADPPGPLPEVSHDLPVAAVGGGLALLGAGTVRKAWRLLRRLAR